MNSRVAILVTIAVVAWPALESAANARHKVTPPVVTRSAKLNLPDAALARINDQVVKLGPVKYLRGVSEANADWQHLLNKLETADPVALSLARRLRPSADAGNAEALDMSAARGLPYAPVAVLDLVHAGASVSALCTSPFIEPGAGVEKRYNQKAIAALDRVPVAQRPQPAFSQCEKALVMIRKTL